MSSSFSSVTAYLQSVIFQYQFMFKSFQQYTLQYLNSASSPPTAAALSQQKSFWNTSTLLDFLSDLLFSITSQYFETELRTERIYSCSLLMNLQQNLRGCVITAAKMIFFLTDNGSMNSLSSLSSPEPLLEAFTTFLLTFSISWNHLTTAVTRRRITVPQSPQSTNPTSPSDEKNHEFPFRLIPTTSNENQMTSSGSRADLLQTYLHLCTTLENGVRALTEPNRSEKVKGKIESMSWRDLEILLCELTGIPLPTWSEIAEGSYLSRGGRGGERNCVPLTKWIEIVDEAMDYPLFQTLLWITLFIPQSKDHY